VDAATILGTTTSNDGEGRTDHSGSNGRPSGSSNDEKQQQLRRWPVVAMWRLGLAQGRHLGYLMGSIRTTTFPQWSFQFVPVSGGGGGGNDMPPPFPFKIKYRQSNKSGLAVSASIGGIVSTVFARLKVCWISLLTSKVSCQYGIKYDGRGMLVPVPLPTLPVWTLLCHVRTPDWSIRVPVYLSSLRGGVGGVFGNHLIDLEAYAMTALSAPPHGPIMWMMCLLVGQYLDQWLEHFNRKRKKRMKKLSRLAGEKSGTSRTRKNRAIGIYEVVRDWVRGDWTNGSSAPTDLDMRHLDHSAFFSTMRSEQQPAWKEAVHQAAERKRQQELNSIPCELVILRATVTSEHKLQATSTGSVDMEDITDLLQFWVVDGKLEVPVDEILMPEAPLLHDARNEQSDNRSGSLFFGWWKISNASLSSSYLGDGQQQCAPHDKLILRCLTIRYRNGGFVYEISVPSSGIADGVGGVLSIPNNDAATQLGPANSVS